MAESDASVSEVEKEVLGYGCATAVEGRAMRRRAEELRSYADRLGESEVESDV